MRLLLLIPLLLSACTRYAYDLTAPPDLAQRIPRDKGAAISLDSINYRFDIVDTHLIIRAYNNGPDPIELLGNESFIVDPSGQSRPMKSQTIPPGTFIKVILPPQQILYRDPGPRIGIGLGVGISSNHRHHPFHGHHFHDPFYDPFYDPWYDPWYSEPRYLLAVPEDGYWAWPRDTEVRIRFAYRQKDQSFHHDLTFRKVKA